MRIMSKNLFFTLLIVLIVALIYLGLDNLLAKKITEAIYNGYPGTEKVEVQLKGQKVKEILQGNIEGLTINIKNWAYDNFQISSFRGEFEKIKINLPHLLRKKTIVVEGARKGQIWVAIDEKNINKIAVANYPGIAVTLEEKGEIAVTLNMSVLGREINGLIRGTLVPGEGAILLFKPSQLVIGGLELPPSLKEKILKNINLKLKLGKIPFTFQVTTVKIMQDKILIQGKV